MRRRNGSADSSGGRGRSRQSRKKEGEEGSDEEEEIRKLFDMGVFSQSNHSNGNEHELPTPSF